MRVLFLTKGDFMNKQNEGGLACRYRNYYLIQQIAGVKNVFICAVISKRQEDCTQTHYIVENQKIVNRYINYLGLRDAISKKTEQDILEYIKKVQPDCVFFDGSTWGNVAEKLHSKKNKIVFFHNIERQYTWNRVKNGNILCFIRYWANRVCEKKQIENVEKFICLNERDNRLLKKYYAKSADLILPITFKDSWKGGTKSDREEYLLFVGSYFDANVQGIRWFMKEVMQHIHYTIKIVGKGMERLKDKLTCDSRVKVIGEVDCLQSYYNQASAIIMPIFMGGGMKVKTAEALMHGKAIFGTREAFEGYEIDSIDGLYECNNAREFIKAINTYREQADKKFYLHIRELFLEKYETDAYIDKLAVLLSK